MGTLVDVKWLESMFRAVRSFPPLPWLSNSRRKGGKVEYYCALSVHS